MEDSPRVPVWSSKPRQTQLDKLLRGGLQPVRTVLRRIGAAATGGRQTIPKVAGNVGLTREGGHSRPRQRSAQHARDLGFIIPNQDAFSADPSCQATPQDPGWSVSSWSAAGRLQSIGGFLASIFTAKLME
jgi:hypothetical protein